MFKLDRKLAISISAVTAATLFSACVGGNTGTFGVDGGSTKYVASHTYNFNGKKVVDGGVTYPVVDGKTGPYYVNEQISKISFNKGREATSAEIKAWDVDVMYNGPFPEGHGTAEEGEEVYEEKCVACHGDFGTGGSNIGLYPALSKGNAYELQQTLTNQRINPGDEGPVRVFGSYWPYPSTAWWYIKTGMPHPAPKSLTNDEVYALVAYMANINELKMKDGTEIDEEFELNQDNFGDIDMPNVNGFVPQITGANGVENIRNLLNTPSIYGARTLKDGRCMTNCQKDTAKVVHITIEQKDFLPPLSEERSLPKEKGGADDKAKDVYEASCAMCHDSGAAGAPIKGDKKAWASFLKKGIDKVYTNGINGINAMPPKGGTTLSDAEFKSVVDYIVNQSK